MVGPTGTGKTTIAVQAIAVMAAQAGGTMATQPIPTSMLRIAAPAWMPAGASKSTVKETISTIAEAVAANSRTLLVIDEIDKIVDRDGDNSWKTYVRGELYDLCDGRWPSGLKSPEDDNENEILLEVLTKKLRETVFVLAIGTFQDWFDGTGSRTIGFGEENNTESDVMTADIIAENLPRELANRFNSSIIHLPELQERHYWMIAKQAEDTLPERMRQAFSEAAAARIAGAISAKKGVRFLEEAMMEVLKNLPPEIVEIAIATTTNNEPEPDPFDLLCTQ